MISRGVAVSRIQRSVKLCRAVTGAHVAEAATFWCAGQALEPRAVDRGRLTWGGGVTRAVEEAAASNKERRPSLVSGTALVLFLADLLAVPFASKRFFHALLLARLQIERMTLYFLDDVFRLHLALKPPQGVLERLAFLHSNLCQGNYTSKSSLSGQPPE